MPLAPLRPLAPPLVVVLCLIASGCKDRREAGAPPPASALAPYDFAGRSAEVLRRICRAAPRLPASRRAHALVLCARTTFDWYLIASLREDRPLLSSLQRFLDRLGALPPGTAPGPRRILTGVERLLAQAEAAASGASLRRIARAGRALVHLQRTESRTWGYAYLKGLREASRAGAPWSTQAQVIQLGAALDALRTLRRTPLERRPRLLLQGLGFPCPAEAERARLGDQAPARPPSCPLACPSLRSLVARLAPGRRKTLIAAQCPLAHLGLSNRAHGVYLSKDNLPLFRVVTSLTRLAASLRTKGDQPLVAALRGAVSTLSAGLGTLKVPLFYPELAPGEPVSFPLALSASADEPARASVYLAVDETRLFAGPKPLLGIVSGHAVPLGFHAGYPFPGQPVLVTDAQSLATRIRTLRSAFSRELGSPTPPSTRDRVTLYVDARLSGGRLNDLLDLLVEARRRHADLIFRNRAGEIRAVPVSIAYRRRSEGPSLAPLPHPSQERPGPPAQPAAASPAGNGALLRVELGRRSLRLSASAGPLASSPVTLPAADVASLRKTLEKTRRAYRGARGVEVRLAVDVPYHALARLLESLRRDTSGRPLYETLWL